MRNHLRLASAGVAAAVAAAVIYVDPPNLVPADSAGHSSAGPFFETFDGPAGAPPNPNVWNVRTGTDLDAGLENYSTGNVSLDGNGNLVLRAEKTPEGYVSGRVDTRNKADFGYGTLSARIKVPGGPGLWPAFWLVGADEDTVPWPASGEIDVIELPGDPSTYHSTLHGPMDGTDETQQVQLSGPIPNLSTDYHDYWVRHLPDSITFGIDGRTLGTLTPQSLPPGAHWVYNRPMYAIANLAVGGEWAGAPDDSKLPATMLVDSLHWDPV